MICNQLAVSVAWQPMTLMSNRRVHYGALWVIKKSTSFIGSVEISGVYVRHTSENNMLVNTVSIVSASQ